MNGSDSLKSSRRKQNEKSRQIPLFYRQWVVWGCACCIFFNILLVPLSWALSAYLPFGTVGSLLSDSGIRWLLCHFVNATSSAPLLWLVLLSVMLGCVNESKIFNKIDIFDKIFIASETRRLPFIEQNNSRNKSNYHIRTARIIAICLLFICVLVIMSLIFLPGTPLRALDGGLYHSPFMDAIIPMIACTVILCTSVYGAITGTFQNIRSVYLAAVSGIQSMAPLFIFYILLTQLYYSVIFVF